MQQGQKRAQHNDLTKIPQMWLSGALPREVRYHHLTVEHDDWCDLFAGQRCHCEPDSTRTFSLAGQAKHEEEGRCDATRASADHL
jgi:hypothetical protein